MRYRVPGLPGAAVAVCAVVWLAPPPAAAQQPAADWEAPRTPWGDPDLQAIWNNATITPLERPAELADQAFLDAAEVAALERQAQDRVDRENAPTVRSGPLPAGGNVGAYNSYWTEQSTSVVRTMRTSLVTDPPDGRLPPLTPAALARITSPAALRLTDVQQGRAPAAGPEEMGLSERCLWYRGIPSLPTGYNNNYHFLQTPEAVLILQEHIHDLRVIHLDGRPHLPPGVRQFAGSSRGRWDGDTLVVETTNLREPFIRRWARPEHSLARGRLSESARVIERFTRTGPDTLDYQFTIDDPETWTRPWSGALPYARADGPMFEFACHEGNYGLLNILTGSRAEEAAAAAQEQPPVGVPVAKLGDGPWVFDTAEQHGIRVSVVTRGLSHPWAIAFLPDGGMLITERPGRLRIVRGGVLDPQPVSGVPQVRTDGNGGLMDVALHPGFAANGLVYLTYTKPVADGRGAPALARGRLAAGRLVDVEDLVVTDSYEGNQGLNGRVAFGRDGRLHMSTGGRVGDLAQDPASLRGKILRLADDGSVPSDNPFVDRPGYRPEIYTLGHRNTLGLMVHPGTGAIWNHENGPNGGDEVNVILPGRNYGWPLMSFGRLYPGARVSEHPTREGFESPLLVWLPAIAVAGMAVYTGDRFPAWRGDLFVGSLREGGIPGTGHLQRIVFNDRMEELRREAMLRELRRRIREVREGPDELLYLLTDDEHDGALLRIEPAPLRPG